MEYDCSMQINSVLDEDALAIYIRASKFNDRPLMKAALPQAARAPLTALSIDDLRVLPATALKDLVSVRIV